MSTRKRPAVGDVIEVLGIASGEWRSWRVTFAGPFGFNYGDSTGMVQYDAEDHWRWPLDAARPFDEMIGRLDRVLSEFLAAVSTQLDEPDRQTVKHHADDLIGVGKKALELLARPRPPLAVGDEIEFATLTGDGVHGWEARTVAYIGATDFKCRGMYEHLTDFTYASEGGLWRRK